MAQSSQPLFFEPNVKFEKVAAEVMLPEDPNEWPNELMQELFKQVPYVADFEPHVTMDRVDAERGFGFGHVEVQNKTEIQHGADPAAMESAGVKNARIPIIIKDRKLQPLDLLVTTDSKVLPLTEARLRSAIFRPQVFDVTGRGPGDMSMVGQLYPPMRNVAGMGGGGATMSVGMGKEGAAEGSLLKAIMPSVNEGDYNALFAKIAEDRGLQAAFSANAGAAPALRALAAYEPVSAAKLASVALDRLKPSVAQLRKEAEGYSLKTASHVCWMPKTESMSRGEALRMFGSKVVIAADQTGSVTMATGEGATEGAAPEGGEPQQNPEQDKPALITAFGAYKVQDDAGTELLGWVFPNLIDIDGKSMPISLFTNGSVKAVQGDIVGISAGAGSAVPEGPPQGSGCFYQTLANGKTQAMVPMTLNASMDSPGEGATIYHGETYDGTPVQVSVQPNIQEVTLVDGHLLVPDTFSWLPLDKAQDVHLVENPEAWGAQAEAKQAFATVQLRCGGADSFAIEGFPVDKLASDDRQFLTLDQTLFLFAGLGADLDYAQTKMGEAAAWSRPVQVRVGRYIKTANSVAGQMREKAASVISLFTEAARGLRKDLLKEAAVIPDPMAVDTVLSLGFLNPENLGVFISYMSIIDNAQAKMCELLLAARLGLREVPVGALEKAVKSTEEALEGLKVLAFQKQ